MTKRFAVDWHTKKDYQLYDLDKEESISLSVKPEEWLKFLKKNPNSEYYLEEGGVEPFKLYAYKLGSKVFTIPVSNDLLLPSTKSSENRSYGG